jgi:hypothetical protein
VGDGAERREAPRARRRRARWRACAYRGTLADESTAATGNHERHRMAHVADIELAVRRRQVRMKRLASCTTRQDVNLGIQFFLDAASG